MKAEELDKLFDSGEDITKHLDMSTLTKNGTQTKKVNVDFPEWIVNSLDLEAKRIGVTRQSIIKVWIAERLKEEAEHLGAGQ
ncbi:MAG: CopG family transcriptional regulator [Campylobacterales bacterium]|nr:CopG family transcriptional regulator [Campylobacterales bacterium]